MCGGRAFECSTAFTAGRFWVFFGGTFYWNTQFIWSFFHWKRDGKRMKFLFFYASSLNDFTDKFNFSNTSRLVEKARFCKNIQVKWSFVNEPFNVLHKLPQILSFCSLTPIFNSSYDFLPKTCIFGCFQSLTYVKKEKFQQKASRQIISLQLQTIQYPGNRYAISATRIKFRS